ncbi:MAG: OsmC family protein [Candidatus Eisenbacteria bacterium]|nr:OsmC family protein [Candidatus Eisenbacteria bacterium]
MDIEIAFGGGKKVDVRYKGFTHRTDQPGESGGEGSAPEPVDLLFAAIAACTAYTVLGFCESRGLPADGLRVAARLVRDEETNRVVRVRHEIRVGADFPEKYRKALVRAANTCSVKRYLENPPEIETAVKTE